MFSKILAVGLVLATNVHYSYGQANASVSALSISPVLVACQGLKILLGSDTVHLRNTSDTVYNASATGAWNLFNELNGALLYVDTYATRFDTVI